jgi:Zn finger protein HypA/HybF involved in hydrogenase expression
MFFEDNPTTQQNQDMREIEEVSFNLENIDTYTFHEGSELTLEDIKAYTICADMESL